MRESDLAWEEEEEEGVSWDNSRLATFLGGGDTASSPKKASSAIFDFPLEVDVDLLEVDVDLLEVDVDLLSAVEEDFDPLVEEAEVFDEDAFFDDAFFDEDVFFDDDDAFFDEGD